MGIKFKCVQSGNVYEFHSEHDIKTMRTHPEYVEVTEQQDKPKTEEVVKRVGRPPKSLLSEE